VLVGAAQLVGTAQPVRTAQLVGTIQVEAAGRHVAVGSLGCKLAHSYFFNL